MKYGLHEQSKISRRSFLKGTAALGVIGLGGFGTLTANAQAIGRSMFQ